MRSRIKTLIGHILDGVPKNLQREFHAEVSQKVEEFFIWRDLEVPFPSGPLFMCWLTRVEWQLCYSLSLAYKMSGELNPELPVDEACRAMVTMLEQEHGHRFNAIRSDPDGQLFARQAPAACQENALFVQMIRRGETPDYLTHAAAALSFAETTDTLISQVEILEDLREKLAKDTAMARKVPMRSDVRDLILENMSQKGMIH